MGFVYKITNDINNKVYIGITTNTLQNRWKQHLITRWQNKTEKRPLYAAMNKYGVEHFSISLVEEVDNKLLAQREQFWIQQYDSYFHGYNATLGGDGTHTRIIEQYDLQGNLLNIFYSIYDAIAILKVSESVIRSCCQHKQKTVKNTILKYQDDNSYSVQELINNKLNIQYHNTKKIYQYNLDGSLERIWNSITEIKTELKYTNIARNINGSKPSHNFVWRSENKNFFDNLDLTSIIVQLDMDFNIVGYYQGFLGAAKSLGKTTGSAISEACRNIGYHKSAYGYYWRYLRDVL